MRVIVVAKSKCRTATNSTERYNGGGHREGFGYYGRWDPILENVLRVSFGINLCLETIGVGVPLGRMRIDGISFIDYVL